MLQTMIVGSLPRPTWLVPPRQMDVSWQLEGESLQEGQEDAVRLAVAIKRRLGSISSRMANNGAGTRRR